MTKRKKKKDLDFQKVKIRIGKRIKRDIKETKAEFSTRKIILKEVRNYSDDPLTALTRHSDRISHQGKLSLLNHFNSALTPEIVKNLTKPILDSLSKFIIDQSIDVRAAAMKCLRTCFVRLKSQQLSTKDFVMSLKPYIDCALTHVSRGIADDCQKFLDYLVSQNEPQTFEPLMMIVTRRLELGNLSVQQKDIAYKLKQYYTRYKQKESFDAIIRSEKMEPLIWTPTNYLLDLDPCIHTHPGGDREVESREVLLRGLSYNSTMANDYNSCIDHFLERLSLIAPG